MTEPAERVYLLSGETDPEHWGELLEFAGKLGLDMQPLAPPETTYHPEGLPYRLSEITSRVQFLSDEHAEEFWPLYASRTAGSGIIASKHDCLSAGLSRLTHPKPRVRVEFTDNRITKYIEGLGVKLVAPRSLKGFPDDLSPGTHEIAAKTPTLIEVGSFLDYMHSVKDQRVSRRPKGLEAPQINFLTALAEHLEPQLQAFEQTAES